MQTRSLNFQCSFFIIFFVCSLSPLPLMHQFKRTWVDPGMFFKRGVCLDECFLFVAGRHVGKWGRNKIANKDACPNMCPMVARRCAQRWPEVPKQSLPKEPTQELPEDAPESVPEDAPEGVPEGGLRAQLRA
jgi:hypothetical protein